MAAEINEMKNRQVLPKPNQNPVGLEAVQKTKKSSSPIIGVEKKTTDTAAQANKEPLKTPAKSEGRGSGVVVVQEGEDEDEEIRKRRDTVQKVRRMARAVDI